MNFAYNQEMPRRHVSKKPPITINFNQSRSAENENRSVMIPAKLAGALSAARAGVARGVGAATLEAGDAADVVLTVSANPVRTCWRKYVAMMAGTCKERGSSLEAFILGENWRPLEDGSRSSCALPKKSANFWLCVTATASCTTYFESFLLA